MCPSCKAPIVGTNPTVFPSLNALSRHARRSAMVVRIGISDLGRTASDLIDVPVVAAVVAPAVELAAVVVGDVSTTELSYPN